MQTLFGIILQVIVSEWQKLAHAAERVVIVVKWMSWRQWLWSEQLNIGWKWNNTCSSLSLVFYGLFFCYRVFGTQFSSVYPMTNLYRGTWVCRTPKIWTRYFEVKSKLNYRSDQSCWLFYMDYNSVCTIRNNEAKNSQTQPTREINK